MQIARGNDARKEYGRERMENVRMNELAMIMSDSNVSEVNGISKL